VQLLAPSSAELCALGNTVDGQIHASRRSRFNPALGLAAEAGLSGLTASVAAGAISGAVSGVASYATQGAIATATGQQFKWSATDLAVSIGFGALGGVAGSALGYGAGRLLSSVGRDGIILDEEGASLGKGNVLDRVYGDESKPFGEWWTTMNPKTPGFPDVLDLPTENGMNGIMTGYFPQGTPVTATQNAAGAVEVQIRNAWFWAFLPTVESW